MAGLLPQLGDEPVDLIAHSLGGLVACRVACSHPGLVGRLVLEDVGLLRPRPPVPPARPDGVLPFDWRVVEQVRPEIDDPDPRWADVAAGIGAPALVVAGGPGSTVPQEHVADLARTLPAGQLVTIDAGHLVHATERARSSTPSGASWSRRLGPAGPDASPQSAATASSASMIR